MKKRILALLLAFFLLPLTALAADGPTLPDLSKFAGNLLTLGELEDFGFCNRVTLYGTAENVKRVTESYVELLLMKYDISKHAHFTNYYDGGQSRRHYALGYTGTAEVGAVGYEDKNEGWEISDACIVITYSQYQSDNFVQITYCSEFNYKDTGDRLQSSIPQSLPATAPTPKTGADAETRNVIIQTNDTPSVAICTVCDGRGAHNAICTTCGGGGVINHHCSTCGGNGRYSCSSCSGKGYSRCGSCSGNGTRSCASCGGTGHHGSSSHGSHHSSSGGKCSSCGGDGKRSCSSCAGSGKQNCNVCSGDGLRQCGSCSGRGQMRSTCGMCSGTGHYLTNCSFCNGIGVIK